MRHKHCDVRRSDSFCVMKYTYEMKIISLEMIGNYTRMRYGRQI